MERRQRLEWAREDSLRIARRSVKPMASKGRAARPDSKTARGGLVRNEMDRDNDTSAQPQTSQWGRLAERLGEGDIPYGPASPADRFS